MSPKKLQTSWGSNQERCWVSHQKNEEIWDNCLFFSLNMYQQKSDFERKQECGFHKNTFKVCMRSFWGQCNLNVGLTSEHVDFGHSRGQTEPEVFTELILNLSGYWWMLGGWCLGMALGSDLTTSGFKSLLLSIPKIGMMIIPIISLLGDGFKLATRHHKTQFMPK